MDRIEEVKRDYAIYKEKNKIEDNRQRLNVVKKYAYINACKSFLGSSDLGRIIGCNHATVLHAWKSHETNKRYSKDSDEYEEFFDESNIRICKLMGEWSDPLHKKTKTELIKMYRELKSQIEALYHYAEEPCSQDEEVPGVFETT